MAARRRRERWGRRPPLPGVRERVGPRGEDDEDDDNDHDEVPEQSRVGDVTPIHNASAHVTIRLCRGEDDGPWMTELVCILFSAQGDVMQIYRGNNDHQLESKRGARVATVSFGDEHVALRRNDSKDAVEKEVLSFSLAALPPSVEAIGVLLTYPAEEIAHRARLNVCDVICDASAGADADASTFGAGRPRRLYQLAFDPRPRQHTNAATGATANYVVVCKLYRNAESRREWFFHAIGAGGAVRSAVNSALAEAMQVFLLDIIPDIELAHRNALNSVASICAALSSDEFLGIESYFGARGVTREAFVKILLLTLLRSRKRLQRLSRAVALVALLFEMFEQIDINGDEAVDWEEFTTFCISVGLISTHEQALGAATYSGCSYRQQLAGPFNRTFSYQIRRIRSLSALRRVAVIENKSAVVLIYDADMTFLHEMNHLQRVLGTEDDGLSLLDVEHVPSRNLLVLSSSDHVISCWSVVNATTGAYVYAFKIGSRCPIPYLRWCAALNRLVTSSSEGVQLWDLEARRVGSRWTHHLDRMTDCLEVPGTPGLTSFIATCGFDAKIMLLELPSLRVAGTLEGHVQGIQHLDFLNGVLVSSGFEHQAYCWSLQSQSLLTTLGGHQASLIGARFVSSRVATATALVVTGDEAGHFRLWDISRCVKGYATELVSLLQSFDVATANLCRFRGFAIGPGGQPTSEPRKARRPEAEVADVITGAFRVYRFHAIVHSVDAVPPTHVTFNSISNAFVGSVDGIITVWSANTGHKVEEPIVLRDADVCGVVFDAPRQRKLFVATSDGAIRLFNPITATMMAKTVIHDGIISALIFCPRSSCLISTGYDRRICVSHSSAGKTTIEVLRTVENAHESSITAASYNEELDLVATGDDAGNVHVYDFQKLYLLFSCCGHAAEILSLSFHYSAAILLSSDADGVAFVWYVASGEYRTAPIMRLLLRSHLSSTFLTEPSENQTAKPLARVAITAICVIPESKYAGAAVFLATSDGLVWGWDYRVLTNHARRFGIGKCFDYRFEADASRRANGPHGLLRVSHKTSVLKLRRAEDAPTTLPAFQRHMATESSPPAPIVESCEATIVFRAHDAYITEMKGIPYPGQLLTVSRDCSIKIWDAHNACIGTISTVVAPWKPGASTDDSSNSSSSLRKKRSPPATWKFSHHSSSEARDAHVRIATEILHRDDAEIEAPVAPTRRHELPPKLAAIQAALEHSLPFSADSMRSGVKQGLFGVEESNRLRVLARDERVISAVKRPDFGPLIDAMTEPSAQQRKHPPCADRSPVGRSPSRELPMMRTMVHYPSEMEKRQQRKTRFEQEVDVAPSPFLLEKLAADASPKPRPRRESQHTTPKKKLSLTMDASAVVLDNVSLPRLDEPPGSRLAPSEDTSGSHRKLLAVASAPTLSVLSQEPPSGDTERPPLIGEVGRTRSNIQRKMRIYADSVLQEDAPAEGPSADANGPAPNDLTRDPASSRPRLGHRQLSQPQLPVTASLSVTKKRASQANLLSAAATPANPFGPHYSTKQVMEFAAMIARFDNDFSGDIDEQEWVSMIHGFRDVFGPSDLEAAERLFHAIDRDDSGKINY
ncbi:hypothetical protein P43SY_001036 [Pythium insidiosum]|uniref:EF-hand domain-containing protein n=1 Tax=Pythium insidiosum TaxID=114742 RepID=A0AAD5Q3F8_PYTIN|nr:hypothetical protein P43SY_001036 [Pythium insidiosum]